MIDSLTFDAAGLIPAIVQDADSGRVLMVAYMNNEALALTLQTGQVHFFSRSRQELWRKGATSGNTLDLVAVVPDCDGDALLVTARPTGPTCHTGAVSCFSTTEEPHDFAVLAELWSTISSRRRELPEGSYTASLVSGGVDAVGRKVLEEAGEVLIAAKDHAASDAAADATRRVAEEAADLLYHLLVLLAEREVAPRHVLGVLAERAAR